MKQFHYIIKEPNGIHAIPACLLANEARKFKSKIMIQKADKKTDITDLINVMGLNVKQNDTIMIQVEGIDETEAAFHMEQIFMGKL